MAWERIRIALREDLRVQILLLPAMALLCAFLSNAFASSARKLHWFGRVPEPVRAEKHATPPATPKVEPQAIKPAPVAPKPDPSPKPREGKVPIPPAVPQPAPPAPTAATRFPAQDGRTVREISTEEALEAHRLGVPFLDARRSAEYALGHVRGAINLSPWESDLDAKLVDFDATGHPFRSPLVLYCSGGDCPDSHLLASKLFERGYRNLLVYSGGFPDWGAKGRPVSKGVEP